MARIIDQLNADLAKPIHNMRMFNAVLRIEFNTAVHAEIFRNAPARVINRRHSSNPMMHRAPKSPVASTSASGYTSETRAIFREHHLQNLHAQSNVYIHLLIPNHLVINHFVEINDLRVWLSLVITLHPNKYKLK